MTNITILNENGQIQLEITEGIVLANSLCTDIGVSIDERCLQDELLTNTQIVHHLEFIAESGYGSELLEVVANSGVNDTVNSTDTLEFNNTHEGFSNINLKTNIVIDAGVAENEASAVMDMTDVTVIKTFEDLIVSSDSLNANVFSDTITSLNTVEQLDVTINATNNSIAILQEAIDITTECTRNEILRFVDTLSKVVIYNTITSFNINTTIAKSIDKTADSISILNDTISTALSIAQVDINQLYDTILFNCDVVLSVSVIPAETVSKITTTCLADVINSIVLFNCIVDLFKTSKLEAYEHVIKAHICGIIDRHTALHKLTKSVNTVIDTTCKTSEFVRIVLTSYEDTSLSQIHIVGEITTPQLDPAVDFLRFDKDGRYLCKISAPQSSLLFEDESRYCLISGTSSEYLEFNKYYHDFETNQPVHKGNKPSQYHTFNYHSKQWEDERDVEKAKDDKWNEIKKLRAEKLEEPFNTPYGVFDGDSKAQKNITDAILMLHSLVAAGQPATINFTLYDNSIVTLTSDEMTTVGLYLGYRTQTVYDRARVLRDQIAACTSVTEVNAIEW